MINIFNLQESAIAQTNSDGNQPTSFFLSGQQFFYFRSSVKKDGNCLFTAVVFHTLGDEDEHDAIHTLLVRETLFESRVILHDNENEERGKNKL